MQGCLLVILYKLYGLMYLLLFEKVFLTEIKILQKMTVVEKIIETCFNKGES